MLALNSGSSSTTRSNAPNPRRNGAAGVSERVIAWIHCFRNAALAPLAYAGIVLAHLVTGSIVVETVFGWPGVGLLALQAVQSRDYPLLQGVVLVFAAIYVVIAFAIDVAYGFLDPRVRA